MPKPVNLNLPSSLKPLQQGALDSLCGMYAAINAIRIADDFEAQPHRNIGSVLSTAAVKYLSRRGELGSIFRFGMGYKRQQELTKHLLKSYRNQYGGQIVLRPSKDSFLSVDHFIESEIKTGNPVCVCLEGAISHYTIIQGVNKKQVLLFDSGGRRFFQRASISLNGRNDSKRYWIKTSSVYSIEFVDPWEEADI